MSRELPNWEPEWRQKRDMLRLEAKFFASNGITHPRRQGRS
ncbi:hypothetical protein GCM10007858_48450 [Bradyrhizobium liaoningense]|nr:hypothetical protein GCM10007858_48450 [Bradyrhizobium liaoningense]